MLPTGNLAYCLIFFRDGFLSLYCLQLYKRILKSNSWVLNKSSFYSISSLIHSTSSLLLKVAFFFSDMPHSLCDLSFPTRGWTRGPLAVKARSPNHWTTREFPGFLFLNLGKVMTFGVLCILIPLWDSILCSTSYRYWLIKTEDLRVI